MSPEGEVASGIIKMVPDLLDYEMLVSAPGITEPDSNFMWASSFRAPVGINVIDESVSLSLFLPEGSELEKDKKLFFNRVGAKLQDGLWQVRRDFKDFSEVYGSAINIALTSFHSVILDYSYIQEGKYYAHFAFNGNDLEGISAVLLSLTEVMPGYKIEYLRKIGPDGGMLSEVDEIAEVSTVCLELLYEHTAVQNGESSKSCNFVMANYLDKGIKTIGTKQNGGPPKLLSPYDVFDKSEKISYFKSNNEDIVELVRRMISNNIILYGLYGTVEANCIRVMLPMPSQQTGMFLKLLNTMSKERTGMNLKLIEISKFGEPL